MVEYETNVYGIWDVYITKFVVVKDVIVDETNFEARPTETGVTDLKAELVSDTVHLDSVENNDIKILCENLANVKSNRFVEFEKL